MKSVQCNGQQGNDVIRICGGWRGSDLELKIVKLLQVSRSRGFAGHSFGRGLDESWADPG